MRSTHSVRLVLALAAMAAAPDLAHAQLGKSQSWTVCTTYGATACGSVVLRTEATITGTNIKVTLHNLQGQGYGDNTIWNTITQVRFWDLVSPVEPGIEAQYVNGAFENGASGATQTFYAQTAHQSGGAVINLQDLDWPTMFGVRGCTTSPYGGGAETCGANESVSFSWSTVQSWDALFIASMTYNVMASVYNGSDTYPLSCNTDPDPNYPITQAPACSTLAHSMVDESQATPEPATVVLFGTGLLGVAMIARRRRARGLLQA